MLLGIPKILSPELLKTLMEMGHGDEIVIADGNFPSASIAATTTLKSAIRADGHGVPDLVEIQVEVRVHQTITHSDNLGPRDLGMLTLCLWAHARGRPTEEVLSIGRVPLP